MNKKHYRDILDSAAADSLSRNTNLWPNISAQLERKSLMTKLRARPILAMLIALLTLLVLSGAAYAIGKVTGYIPGVGFIDLSVPVRVLAEPVTVERGGIQVTVKQVVLSADATFISYQMAIEGDAEDCWASPRLQLSDGRVLDEFLGDIGGYPYEGDITFVPLPQDVNNAILLFDCTQENFEIPLHFVPAPLDKVAPIIELEIPPDSPRNALVLEKVVETEGSYILFGRFDSIGFPKGVAAIGESRVYDRAIDVTDANRQRIHPCCGIPDGNVSLTGNGKAGSFPWVYEIKGKEQAWPLTVTFNSVIAEVTDMQQAEFNFDTGPNPQGGQKWIVDQDIVINGYSVHVDYILYTGTGYVVKIAYNPDIAEVDLEIVNAENPGSTYIGGSSSWEVVEGINSGISYNLQYEGEVPSGKMKIRFNELWVNIKGKWQLQWQPDAVP